MEKINISELLKDCPTGMELDSPMYDNLYFDKVEEDYRLPISCYTMYHGSKTSVFFTEFGSYNEHKTSKCVIFPKGKTTWEGFVPPRQFKDGDILFVESIYDWIVIYKANENQDDLYKYVATPNYANHTYIVYDNNPLCYRKDATKIRFATEEEKAKLFKAIKDRGYKWNSKTKTLEILIEPNFKVGDWVTNGICKVPIHFITDTHYWYSANCILGSIESVDKQYHLWTINDAKDGDVLVTVNDENRPFIYKGCLDPNHPDSPVAYCGIDADGYFCSGGGKFNHWWTIEKVQPATKEQRDTLMKAMTDAGYTFDFDKKELKLLISNGSDFESNNSKQKSIEWSEEDRRMRKAILTGLIDCRDAPDLEWSNFGGVSIDDCIAWLEKQVGPKFHKGDWVTDGVSKCQIHSIDDTQYWYSENCVLGSIESVDKQYHLWTINDAKDGDVLFHSDSASNGIFIFKEILQLGTLQKVICYCDYDSEDGFCLGENHTCCWADSKILRPATEERRNRLFQKMREAGYKWNAETKTLDKLIEPSFKVGDKVRHKNNHGVVFTITSIEEDYYVTGTARAFWFDDQDDYELVPNKFDINTLKPFNKVLVRCRTLEKWRIQFFEKYEKTHPYPFICLGGINYKQCIPYECNEHLLDTANDCQEFYKNWE